MMTQIVERYTTPVNTFLFDKLPLVGIFAITVITIFLLYRLYCKLVFNKAQGEIDRECVLPWADEEEVKNAVSSLSHEGAKASSSSN